jgi:hypothetical protein
MRTGASPPTEDETRIRSELRSIVEATELLAQRLRGLHARIPIPLNDELMLVGEEEPDFLHVARIVLECVLADHLTPLSLALRSVLEEKLTGIEEEAMGDVP